MEYLQVTYEIVDFNELFTQINYIQSRYDEHQIETEYNIFVSKNKYIVIFNLK